MQTVSLRAMRTQYPNAFSRILNEMNQHHCSRCGVMMAGETCMDIFSDYAGFQF